MQRSARSLVFVAIGLVALLALALLGLNLYVQSEATQTRIQQELSHRIHAHLQIKRMSVTPWGGLKLTGITIPQTPDAPPGDFLDARAFRLRVSIPSLFQRMLVIKEVALIEPHVVWRQNEDGKWRLPTSDSPTNDTTARSEPAGAEPVPAATPSAAIPDRSSGPTERTPFQPEVRKVKLTGGSFQFLDENGKVVARFEGVDFFSAMRRSLTLRGDARVAKISLRDRFFLSELRSPLRYEPTAVDLSAISAHAAGGDLSGSFALQQQAEGSPFKAVVKFQHVVADRLVMEAGGPAGVVTGQLEGHLEAAGKTANPDALEGSGEIILRDGQVQQYSLLSALGQVLQIDELTQLNLEEAHAKFHITPGVVNVDELVLRSPNIRLSASGTIKFNGKLRLDSRLAIDEKIRGQLFRPIAQNFQPTADAGMSAVDFQVSGTIDKPKSNLVDRIVGRDLKDLGSVVDMFLGRDKNDRGKKKAPSPVTAPVGAAASPAPSP